MPKMTMRDGARLHYLDIGRGPVCVLLHGFAMQSAMWLPFVAPLAHRWRFIIPDLRGFGFSHRLPLAHQSILDQHAHDLHDLMEGLQLGRVHLAGLSMGACTSLQYHRLYGFDRVHAYLNIDQSPCVRNDAQWRHGVLGERQEEMLARWAQLAQDLMACGRDTPFAQLPGHLRRGLFSTLSEFLVFGFHHPAWQLLRHAAKQEPLMRYVAPTANWPIYLDTLTSYQHDDYDWREDLRRVRIPMTVMIGMRSTMYPAQGQLAFRELVPHARIVRVENVGHVVPFEAPLRFVRELARFLAGARAAPRLVAAA
ncbi:MAG TPA: alpha/beta hydrolase [Nevskiaceae bacterium]|nr:alpha/beta hydrolase [Nevskiaceae bacterium]